MYLVLTLAALIAATIMWFKTSARRELQLGTLCLIYSGATIMWSVDFIIAFAREGISAFETGADAVLIGCTSILFGLIIWGSSLLYNRMRRRYGN